MTYSIYNVREVPHLLSEIISLGDSQKSTLGFLPEKAFIDYSERGQILVAVSDDEKVIGYVLFARNRNLVCRLSHVCVSKECRSKGIASSLISELKNNTSYMKYILVKCRRDYGIDKFWENNGFVAISESPGRGNAKTILTLWRYSVQPDLFSLAPESDKITVVLDLNIIISALIECEKECESLLTFTYADDIDYRVSQHSYLEVNKNNDEAKRTETRKCLNTFSRIAPCPDIGIFKEVLSIVGESRTDDARQIASAIYGNAYCFITKDGKLSRLSSKIAQKFGMYVYSPTEFVVNYCNKSGHDLYFPGCLPKTEITFTVISNYNQHNYFNVYKSAGEKKSEFIDKTCIDSSRVNDYSLLKIEIDGEEVGLYMYSVQNNILTIHLLRLKDIVRHKQTINTHIIEKILHGAVKSGADQIDFIDNRCGNLVETGLLDAGFQPQPNKLFKPVGKGFLTTPVALEKAGLPSTDERLSSQSLLELEKILWPAKIEELSLPVYLVPIKPGWANKLISSKGFQSSLFGTPDIVLQTRRVYYRSTQGRAIQAPGRIIWYISINKGVGLGKCAIAISMIDEVDVAPATQLFSKYERFGVYTWPDILKTAKNDPHKSVMAITFSKTEVFNKPISYKELSSIVKDCEERNINLVAPYLVSQKTFMKVCELGFNRVI